MKKWLISLISLLFLGCMEYSYQQKASYPALSSEILKTDTLTFITKNGDQYSLQVVSISPQVIQGKGMMRKEGHTWENYDGAVRLDSISLILAQESSMAKNMVFGISALMLLPPYFESLKGPSDPSIELAYATGSSCPYIYSKSDTGYCLEAEAFGTALGKAMEIETSSPLSALSFSGKDLRIRITNERFETHYINSVSLTAVTHPADAEVVLDNTHSPWLISQTQKPLIATDHSGRNITALLDSKDSGFWESDLANTEFNSSLQDSIVLQFARPPSGTGAALVVDAINTELITSVYQSVFNFLGDDAMRFLHKLETDTNMISLMHKWLQDCALHVYLWNDNRWENCGFILPEANAVPFQRLVHLNLPESKEQILHIMVRSLPDVWKLDAIRIDWTPARASDIKPLRLIRAEGQCGSDQIQAVLCKDDNYAVLLPGEKIDLVFEKNKFKKDQTVTALISVRGYLHEWLLQDGSSTPFSVIGNILGNDRIATLTYLMNDKRLLLPPIYADWKNYKQKGSAR